MSMTDLGVLADALERNPDACKFMAGPQGYGKTSLGLRVFLKSALREKQMFGEAFQYYLYLAFSGNGGRYYQLKPWTPSTDAYTARNQGAAFMLECVTAALNKPSWERDTQRRA